MTGEKRRKLLRGKRGKGKKCRAVAILGDGKGENEWKEFKCLFDIDFLTLFV